MDFSLDAFALTEFDKRCEASSSLAELEILWRTQINALGFRYAALGAHVDPLRPGNASYVFQTYPSAWIERFSSKNYKAIDPVYRATATGLTDFDWSDSEFLQLLTWRQRRVLSEAREFQLLFGRSHTLAPVLSITASASLVADQPEWDPATYSAAKFSNLLVHSRATQLCVATLTGTTILSRRERQCLEFCAQGLTDDEIAVIVQLSTHTVRRHIESARARFGVSSRIQAATRAIASGQIQPWN